MTLTIGSMFSGTGGLDLAVEAVTGAHPAWFCEWDDAPSKILAHHWPDVPNYRDVTTIDWSAVPPVDIITGGSPCFTEDVPVLTARGYVPIQDVSIGDLVLTHKNRWKEVTNTMTREAETVEFLPGFYATPEHRIWTRIPGRVWDNDRRKYQRVLSTPRWTEAQNLKGQFVAQPTTIPVVADMPDIPEGINAWHLGRWVADGWVGKAGQPVISIGYDKADRDISKFDGSWRQADERTSIKMHYRTGSAGAFFTENFRSGAYSKTIPAWVLSAPEQFRRDFLDGYWSGDGYKYKQQATRSASVSPFLTVGIRTLENTLGYTTAVHYNRTADTTVIEGRTVNQRDWWSVTATPDDGRFTEVIGEHRWSKIRRDPNPAGMQTVYDITVSDDHSFVAAGIVVHNCQDLSLAGARRGMTDGTRSNLWVAMREAIATIRPRLVVWENVRGALSATATSESDMEPGAGLLGGGTGHLRALGRVLGDLASIGYDAQWQLLRASDVGAPHHRARVFLIAYPADTGSVGLQAARRGSGSAAALAGPVGGEGTLPALNHLPTPNASDSTGGGQTPDKRTGHSRQLIDAVLDLGGQPYLPTPTVGDRGGADSRSGAGFGPPLGQVVRDESVFGKYEPVVHRWEQVTGMSAPAPTELNKNGRPRLNAAFAEFMMGLPPGWVTQVPGVTRAQQLKACGNGVVPQQAAAALRHLLE